MSDHQADADTTPVEGGLIPWVFVAVAACVGIVMAGYAVVWATTGDVLGAGMATMFVVLFAVYVVVMYPGRGGG